MILLCTSASSTLSNHDKVNMAQPSNELDDRSLQLSPETRSKYRVIIIGAGICGLATAIGLAKAGFEVTVLERSPELREVGAPPLRSSFWLAGLLMSIDRSWHTNSSQCMSRPGPPRSTRCDPGGIRLPSKHPPSLLHGWLQPTHH